MNLDELKRLIGRRFARLVTNVVTRVPGAWPVFRRLIGRQFHGLAPQWEQIVSPAHLAPLEAALETIDSPGRALDLGTGTGRAAFMIARRYPDAEVAGADLAPAMIEEARRLTPAELEGRLRFDVADASRLPYPDETFDLVTLANMIPFYDELARVVAPGGAVVFAFARGAETPIYVPSDRLRAGLEPRGFAEFADFAAGDGTALVARKGNRA